METKSKLLFATPILDVEANAFGYATHTRYMKEFCQKHFEYSNEAETALTIICADKFQPVAGKVNVLFTMWEFLQLPKSYLERMKYAQALVVPSSWCKDLFRKYTSLPIYVCREGVDSSKFRYFDRTNMFKEVAEGKRKFRFLWVGAPNPRKGYPLVLEAIKLFERFDNIEIYIKTTVPKMNVWQTLKSVWKHKKDIFSRPQGRRSFFSFLRRIPRPQLANKVQYFGKHKNIIFDTRKLPFEDLIGLYNSAHCFLLPTMGEGWGLTLCEAMATGCPSIATNVTGVQDYYDDTVGYPIKYSVKEQDLQNYELKAEGYIPDTQDFVEKMVYVITNYGEALKKGKKASERILNKFTWEKSALRMKEIISEIEAKSLVSQARRLD